MALMNPQREDTPQVLPATRFNSSVLYASFGTTFTLPENQPERWMAELLPEEVAWVHHFYGDSRPSAAEFGYSPTTWWTFHLPAIISHRLADKNVHPRIAKMWFEGDQPRVNSHGGDGCPTGPALAAAWQMKDLYRFLDRRVMTMLEPHPFPGEQPGTRPILFLGHLFAGSSHGPGVTIPTLLALDNVLKSRQLLGEGTQRILMVTVPDFADGASPSRHRQQQANAMGFLLALDALAAKFRRDGAFNWPVGEHNFRLENLLVDEVIIFGGHGKASSLQPDECSKVVAHCAAVLGAQGTGVGKALEDHAIQLRQLVLGDEGNHSLLFGRLGVYEIRFDREMAARRLGQRLTYEAIKLLMARRFDQENTAVASLLDRIAEQEDVAELEPEDDEPQDEGSDPFERWLGRFLSQNWTSPEVPSGDALSGETNEDNVRDAMAYARAMAAQITNATALKCQYQIELRLRDHVDKILMERLQEGHLDSLAQEMKEAFLRFESAARRRKRSAVLMRSEAEAALNDAATALTDPPATPRVKPSFWSILTRRPNPSPNPEAEAVALENSFNESCRDLIRAHLEARSQEALAEALEAAASLFQGRIQHAVKDCLHRLKESVSPPRGYYHRRVVDDVDWKRIQHPIPSLEVLWDEDVEEKIFWHEQQLLQENLDGEWEAKPGEMGRILSARQQKVSDALRRGDDKAVIRELEEHFTAFFAENLATYTFSSFCHTFLGGIEKALVPRLVSAYAFAQGWARTYGDVDGFEYQTVIEAPADDPKWGELVGLAMKQIPDPTPPKPMKGYRTGAPALFIAQAAHGFRLTDLQGFRSAATDVYPKHFAEQYDLFRKGKAGPILSDVRLERLIAEQFPEEWEAVLTGSKAPGKGD